MPPATHTIEMLQTSPAIAFEIIGALGVLDHPEERTMGDVIDFHGLDPKIVAERRA